MAGEGTKYIKKKTNEYCRLLLQNFLAQTQDQSACTIAKIDYARKKAIFPDGTELDVEYVGDTTNHMTIRRTSGSKSIAHKQEAIKAVIGGSKKSALILEMFNGQLNIRRMGSATKYAVPNILDSRIATKDYHGGFSSNGKHLFIGGSIVLESGAVTLIEWAIFHNFRIQNNELIYDFFSAGQTDLNDVFEQKITPQISAPAAGEEDTKGLAGKFRAKYLQIYNAQFSKNTSVAPTLEEQIAFVNYIIDFFELTPEEVDLLFPPSFWATLYKHASTSSIRFNPTTLIQFDSFNNPYQYVFDGLPGFSVTDFPDQITTVVEQFIGHREDIYESITPPKPAFMEFAFEFNNDLEGNPVLDIIASYQTVTIYGRTYNQFETHWQRNMTYVVSLATNAYFEESKYDREAYHYHDVPENWLYQVGDVTVPYLFTDPPGGTGVNGFNFYMEGKGDTSYLDGTGGQFNDYTRYLPYQWATCVLPVTDYTTQCPNGFMMTGGGGQAVIDAGFNIYGGHPFYSTLYPPDENEYDYHYFDGTSQLNQWTYYDPTKPPFYPSAYGPGYGSFFSTSYPYVYEPYFQGYFINEDSVWGGTEPTVQVVQFGRGVMAITGVNNTPIYKYIDRPPASPGDFDEITQSYLGVNGGRALLTKEKFYSAYAYSPEYTTTTNQITGLDAPDTFTDIYFIDKGTWPFFYEALKAVNSKDFVQYWHVDETEYVANVHVEQNPTKVTVKAFNSGKIPADAGLVVDYVVVGSKYA